jgi:hypothetical protein
LSTLLTGHVFVALFKRAGSVLAQEELGDTTGEAGANRFVIAPRIGHDVRQEELFGALEAFLARSGQIITGF